MLRIRVNRVVVSIQCGLFEVCLIACSWGVLLGCLLWIDLLLGVCVCWLCCYCGGLDLSAACLFGVGAVKVLFCFVWFIVSWFAVLEIAFFVACVNSVVFIF